MPDMRDVAEFQITQDAETQEYSVYDAIDDRHFQGDKDGVLRFIEHQLNAYESENEPTGRLD